MDIINNHRKFMLVEASNAYQIYWQNTIKDVLINDGSLTEDDRDKYYIYKYGLTEGNTLKNALEALGEAAFKNLIHDLTDERSDLSLFVPSGEGVKSLVDKHKVKLNNIDSPNGQSFYAPTGIPSNEQIMFAIDYNESIDDPSNIYEDDGNGNNVLNEEKSSIITMNKGTDTEYKMKLKWINPLDKYPFDENANIAYPINGYLLKDFLNNEVPIINDTLSSKRIYGATTAPNGDGKILITGSSNADYSWKNPVADVSTLNKYKETTDKSDYNQVPIASAGLVSYMDQFIKDHNIPDGIENSGVDITSQLTYYLGSVKNPNGTGRSSKWVPENSIVNIKLNDKKGGYEHNGISLYAPTQKPKNSEINSLVTWSPTYQTPIWKDMYDLNIKVPITQCIFNNIMYYDGEPSDLANFLNSNLKIGNVLYAENISSSPSFKKSEDIYWLLKCIEYNERTNNENYTPTDKYSYRIYGKVTDPIYVYSTADKCIYKIKSPTLCTTSADAIIDGKNNNVNTIFEWDLYESRTATCYINDIFPGMIVKPLKGLYYQDPTVSTDVVDINLKEVSDSAYKGIYYSETIQEFYIRQFKDYIGDDSDDIELLYDLNQYSNIDTTVNFYNSSGSDRSFTTTTDNDTELSGNNEIFETIYDLGCSNKITMHVDSPNSSNPYIAVYLSKVPGTAGGLDNPDKDNFKTGSKYLIRNIYPENIITDKSTYILKIINESNNATHEYTLNKPISEYQWMLIEVTGDQTISVINYGDVTSQLVDVKGTSGSKTFNYNPLKPQTIDLYSIMNSFVDTEIGNVSQGKFIINGQLQTVYAPSQFYQNIYAPTESPITAGKIPISSKDLDVQWTSLQSLEFNINGEKKTYNPIDITGSNVDIQFPAIHAPSDDPISAGLYSVSTKKATDIVGKAEWMYTDYIGSLTLSTNSTSASISWEKNVCNGAGTTIEDYDVVTVTPVIDSSGNRSSIDEVGRCGIACYKVESNGKCYFTTNGKARKNDVKYTVHVHKVFRTDK